MTDPVPPVIDGLTAVKRLGSGGFADVFLYEEATPKRPVAVKVLRDPGLSPKTIDKFTAEANAMARLEHTYIVPVYSTGLTRDGRPYIKMRYYPRPSLAERARRERFSVPEVLQLGIHLGSAVETAHGAGILHRDIKPANVLTNANGKPGLTDFGIAAQVTDEDDPETGVSVPWSPPETLYGTAPASVRSDVYSLAATLWHLLVGRSPFEVVGGDNGPFAMVKRIRDAPAPSTGRGDVPPSLDRLLRSAMSKDPNGRPSTVREFIGALQSIEQEMRLPRTEAELLQEYRTKTMAAVPPLSEATIMRSPQVVAPVQPSLAAHSPVADTTWRREAPASPEAWPNGAPERTILRQASPDPEFVPEPSPQPVRRLGIVILAIVVVAVASGVGYFLLSGRTSTAATVTPSASAVAPDVGIVADPTNLTVSGKRGSGEVAFTWDYDNSLANDQVEWRVKGDDENHLSTPEGQARVAVSGSGQICIEVRISRYDGSYSQGDRWTKGCG